MLKRVGLIFLLGLGYLAPCRGAGQTPEVSVPSADAASSCMKRLWKALIPVIAANNGYLVPSDLERIAQVRLSPPVAITPTDSISSFVLNGPYPLSPKVPGSLVLKGTALLSLRLELHSEQGGTSSLYTWQRMQGRINGTRSSNLDLTCFDGGSELSLQEAESDLEALGLKRVGTLSQPQRVEIYYRNLKGRVDLFYEIPAATAPAVISIHVAGSEIKRKQPPNSPP